MLKTKKILKKPVFWVGAAVVVTVVLALAFSGSGSDGKYDYTEVEKGPLTQEVSVTGDVQPIEGVNLAFEQSGRVKKVGVGVGDEVYRGEPLVFLEANDLYADLEESEASLEAEKAKLLELKRGATAYEIKVKEAELDEVKQDLKNDYDDAAATVQNAYAQADDAVRTKTAEMFRDYGGGYALEYNACDSTAENFANFKRLEAENLLNEWREKLDYLDGNSSRVELGNALDFAQAGLLEVSRFLNYVGDTLTTGCELSNSDVSTYRGRIGTARDNVNTALSAVNTLEQSIAANQSTVNRTERELEELLGGASEEEVAVQEAIVEQTSAKVNSVKSQIEKTILRAPFSGTVTKVDADIGEIIEAYDLAVSIISSSGFKIEVNIPEVDVFKVNVGDSAEVTLDAYGNDVVFNAEVITIDLAETVIEGVSTYGATLEFVKSDERIKSGMTANVDILTGRREDVVYVPQRAVIQEDSRKFVRILKGEEMEERDVVLGMKDSMGNIEVKEGIEEGEKVVIFINEN